MSYDPRNEIRLIIGAGAEAEPIITRPMRYEYKGDKHHMVKMRLIRATPWKAPGTLEAIYRRID